MSTTQTRVYNFSAGPAVLPESVLERIRDEMIALPGVGSSVLEVSHRGEAYKKIHFDARDRFRTLFSVPETHEILFLQGGSILQNAMIPANLLVDNDQTADCIVTGSWSKKNSGDVKYYGKLNIAWDGGAETYSRVPSDDELALTKGAGYVHYTSNETIHGVQFHRVPNADAAPLVCDMSSDILSRPVDVSRYGLIYACAQKNSGISGLTVVVIRKDLMERCGDRLPTYLNYRKHAEADSMANTPPTFAIYVSGLVCQWLADDVGGLKRMQEINGKKAALLYDVIDRHSGFYQGHARKEDRSIMNVVFRTPDEAIDKAFLSGAAEAGMTTLKGHRSLGGIRASIYNAMPVAGVEALAQFMDDFANARG